MDVSVKQRLYASLVVVVCALTVVAPYLLDNYSESRMAELGNRCFKLDSEALFDFCRENVKREGALSFWEYFLPYLPGALLIWANWLLKPGLRSVETYPRRTVTALIYLGASFVFFLCGATFWVAITTPKPVDFGKYISIHNVWTSLPTLLAPMLFNYIVGPTPSTVKLKLAKIALAIAFLTPFLASVIAAIRSGYPN